LDLESDLDDLERVGEDLKGNCQQSKTEIEQAKDIEMGV